MKQRSIILVAAAVAAALIGIILVFALSSQAPKFISDPELQKKTEQRAEVKAFLSKYPEAQFQFNRNETIRNIDYFTIIDGTDKNARFTYVLKIDIFTDNSGEIKQLLFTCSKTDGVDVKSYTLSKGIEEDIRNENCLRL